MKKTLLRRIAIATLLAVACGGARVSAAEPIKRSSIPTDKRLKMIFDNFVEFRSDLALKHLGPILRAQAKKGLGLPQERLAMARLMALVGFAYLIDDNYLAGLNSVIAAHKLCPDDAHIKCMLAGLYRELPDFAAEDRLVDELKAIPEEKRFSYLYTTLAKNARRKSDLRLASEYLEKSEALDIEKRQASMQLFFARMLVQAGLNSAAVKRFKIAADRTENKYEREIMLANAASIQFDDEACEEHLRKASKIYPADPIWRLKLSDYYFQRGKEKEAIALAQEALGCKRFSVSAYLKLARFYLIKRDFEKALYMVQHLERRTRVTADTLAFRGEVEAARNNRVKAEQLFKQALKMNPNNANTYEIMIAFYSTDPKTVERAVKVSENYVKELPHFWPTHFAEAKACVSAKQLVAAEKAALRTLALLSVYPKDDLNLYTLHRAGIAHSIVGTKALLVDDDLERAASEAKLFNQMKFNPDLPPYLRVVMLRPERISFKAGLGLKDPMIFVAIADMLLENDYVDEAIAQYKKAQALAPDNQAVRSYLIHAYSRKGDWSGAANENLAFSQTLVNQVPGAIEEWRNGKKKPAKGSEKTAQPAR